MARIYLYRLGLILLWTFAVYGGVSGCTQAKQALVIPELERRLGAAFHGTARIGDARYDSDNRQVHLHDVVIDSKDGSLRGRLDRITASTDDARNLNWTASAVTLHGGSLQVRIRDPARGKASEPHGLPTRLSLDKIELAVQRGNTTFGALVTSGVVQAQPDGFELETHFVNVELAIAGDSLSADAVDINAKTTGDTVRVDTAQISKSNHQLSLSSARLDLARPGQLSGTVRGSLPLDEVLATDELLTMDALQTLPGLRAIPPASFRSVTGAEIQFNRPLQLRRGMLVAPCKLTLTGLIDGTRHTASISCTPSDGGVTVDGDVSSEPTSARLTFKAALAMIADPGPIEIRKFHVSVSDVPASWAPQAAGFATDASRIGGTLDATGQLWPTRLQGQLSAHLSKPNLGRAARWVSTDGASIDASFVVDKRMLVRADTRLTLGPGNRIAGHGVRVVQAIVPGSTWEPPSELIDVQIIGKDLSARAARLDLRPTAGRPAKATFKVDRLPSSALVELLGLPDQNLLRPTGVGAGTIELSAQGRSTGTKGAIRFNRPQVAGITFDRGEVTWQNHTAGPQPSARQAPQLLANFYRGDGTVRIEQPNTTDPAAGARITIDRLRVGEHRMNAQGHLGARASIKVTVDDPMLVGRGAAALRLLGPSAPNRTSLCPSAPAPSSKHPYLLCGSTADRTLSGYLRFGERGHDGPVEGRLDVRDADIWRLLPGAAALPAGAATVSATITAAGRRLWPPETLSGEAEFRELDVRYAHISGALATAIRVPLVDGQIRLRGLEFKSDDGALELHGFLGLDGTRAIQAMGHLRTYAAVPLLPMSVRGRGRLDIRAELAERLALTLTPVDASIDLSTGHKLRQLSGEASWSTSGWQLIDAGADFEQGRVTANGLVGADGSLDLHLTANNVQLQPEPRVALHLSGDVHVSKDKGSAPKASGELSVSKLFYGRHIQFPEVILAKDPAKATKARIALDLKISQTGPWKLRNGLLDVSLQSPGGIAITGTDAAFGIIGDLQLAGGRLKFYNDELKFRTGAVSFTSGTALASKFHFSADAPAKLRPGARVQLQAKGSESKFTLRVRCNAGRRGAVPEPFVCRYDGTEFACPDYTKLANLWRCAPP